MNSFPAKGKPQQEVFAMSLIARTNNQDIDGILWGVKWDLTSLTYGFATSI